MSAAAGTNDIFVDEETSLSSKGVAFEDLGSIKVKGKKIAINIFRPLRGKAINKVLKNLAKAIVGRVKEREEIDGYIDELVAGDGGCTISISGPIVSVGGERENKREKARERRRESERESEREREKSREKARDAMIQAHLALL